MGSTIRKPSGYWNLENCKNDALLYVSKKQWEKASISAYLAAHRNKWLEECCKHMIRIGSLYERLIYSFEFPDKSVYVGLTFNPKRRKQKHLVDVESQVYKYIKLTNQNPEFVILTDYLIYTDASIKEGLFVDVYRNNGWKILNKIKTGGLGTRIKPKINHE